MHYWGPLRTSRASWHFPESVTLPLLASDPWKSQTVIFVFWEFWQIFIKSGVWNVDLGRFFIISTQQVNFIQMIAIYFFIIFFFDLAKLLQHTIIYCINWRKRIYQVYVLNCQWTVIINYLWVLWSSAIFFNSSRSWWGANLIFLMYSVPGPNSSMSKSPNSDWTV